MMECMLHSFVHLRIDTDSTIKHSTSPSGSKPEYGNTRDDQLIDKVRLGR